MSLLTVKRFDDRVFQKAPEWTVEAGAVSLSSANFVSLSANSGQVTFQIQAPSQSVYLDRLVQWQQTCAVKLQVNMTQAPEVYPQAVVVPGRDFALCSSPLHSLVTSIQATICNQQVSSNLNQNREIMDLLSDTPMDREWRTYPCALDVFADYNDAYGTSMNPLAGFDSATYGATIGNGAWPLVFTNPAGSPTTAYTDAQGNLITFTAQGLPRINIQTDLVNAELVDVYFQFQSVEPLQISPFIWREVFERKTGLSQIQNLQVIMNIQSALQARLIRSTSAAGRLLVSQALWPIGSSGSPFAGSGLVSQFLTPPPDLPAPAANVVDLQTITPYVYPTAPIRVQGSSQGPVQTQTLSLNAIPDYIIVAVQPTPAYMTSAGARTLATFYVPIVSVSATWSNVAGLLSSQSQQQLFGICKANGLKMTWPQWRGFADQASAGREGTVQLTGGPLILRPGIDLTLPPGQASGQSNGQWTFSVQLQVDTSAIPVSILQDPAWALQTTVLAVNSGFFATVAGECRITIGPLAGPMGAARDDPNALSSIPVAGSVSRPEFTELYEGARLIGSGGPRNRMRMSDRVRR
jgi:hypothetical protein